MAMDLAGKHFTKQERRRNYAEHGAASSIVPSQPLVHRTVNRSPSAQTPLRPCDFQQQYSASGLLVFSSSPENVRVV